MPLCATGGRLDAATVSVKKILKTNSPTCGRASALCDRRGVVAAHLRWRRRQASGRGGQAPRRARPAGWAAPVPTWRRRRMLVVGDRRGGQAPPSASRRSPPPSRDHGGWHRACWIVRGRGPAECNAYASFPLRLSSSAQASLPRL